METINIPGVGIYDNSIPFNSQELAVREWGLSLIYSGGTCTADELCGVNPTTSKEVRRPKEMCYFDNEKSLVLKATYNYNVSPKAPNAFQPSSVTYKLEEI